MALSSFWGPLGLFSTLSRQYVGPNVTHLGQLSWTLTNANLSISVPGKVPSSVHLDLFDAKVIGDPYYGLNDFNLRWVNAQNWTYSADLDIPLIEKNGKSAYLLFNGLDTFATIELCGKHVGSTNNQFRQYYFDVTTILANCSSTSSSVEGPGKALSVNFGSAADIGKRIAEQPGQESKGVEGIFQYQHRQFVRKEQSDFGWDWGPAFVPAGIWQPAFLVQLDPSEVYIRNSLADIYREGQLPLIRPDQSKPWVLNASIDAIGTIPPNSSFVYDLRDRTGKRIASGLLENVTRSSNTISGSTIIPADKVELWWPVGLGPQTLYDLRFGLVKQNSTTLTSASKRVGFRTIVLNQEPITKEEEARGIAPGAHWHFEINGREFYAKGSNFIPPDAFWTRVTERRIRTLFDSVVRGNQNMLRVWSSGAYLPDFAYDIADELGILLWSEFQFGDALYPADKEFLDNVREEAHYQIRRINHHPSLALWAGGNELENLELPAAARGDPEQYKRYLAEYETLFLDVLGTAVFENSRSISYTPSSTSHGWKSLNFSRPRPIEQRYGNVEPGGTYGNTDYYNYNYEMAFAHDAYPVGRFSNEFGFHSMPSIHSWAPVLNRKDLTFDSPVVRLRNHHYPSGNLDTNNFGPADRGMDEMTGAVKKYYPTPDKRNPVANFTNWCHATQIFQADYYSSQIQFYRRGSGQPERQLGSLYWQLEDIWQAPTWAGIEYDGRWKVLHYIAKDRYSNVIISPFYNNDTGLLEVYVTSDLWDSASGWASFKWFDWSGRSLDLVSSPASVPVNVGAINSTLVYRTNVRDALRGVDPNNAVLLMETSVYGRLPNSASSQEFRHQNWFHPLELAKAKLVNPEFTLGYKTATKKLVVSTKNGIAAWVWLDHSGDVLVHFEKNGFWVRPGFPVELGFDVKWDRTSGKWLQDITIRSLWDLTTH